MKAWSYITEGFVNVFAFCHTPKYEEENMESVYRDLIKVHKEIKREYDQEMNKLLKRYKKTQRISKNQIRDVAYARYKRRQRKTFSTI